MMNKKLILNVIFTRVDDAGVTIADETQFDIQQNEVLSMINELLSLFNDFCRENRFKSPRIEHVYVGKED